MDKVKEQVEKAIDNISQGELQVENLDMLGKLVDIHKDIENEEYWKCKKEVMKMRYNGDYGNDYGNYGRRDSRGRYSARYRGDDMINDMHESYRDYANGKEEYGRGNYRGKEESMKGLDYMLKSVTDFVSMLQDEANSQEEMELIKKYTRKISEM